MSEELQRSCVRSIVDHKTISTLRQDVQENNEIEKSADILALLGNSTRLKILYCLAKAEELCVCDLSDVLGMEVSAISHQLRRLKDRELVTSRREGLTIYYRLNSSERTLSAFHITEMVLQSELAPTSLY